MPLPRYNDLDLWDLGEPLTPFLTLTFRGSPAFAYTFPDKTNRIYVENATFDVLNDQGYSTASISLIDPNFVNLEVLFLKALFLANSLTIAQGNWYCSALWGWTSYGKATGGQGPIRTSGQHYYMLKNLSYVLTDVELRVQLDLMDIGYASHGTSGQDTPKMTVGLLAQGGAIGATTQQLINGAGNASDVLTTIMNPVTSSLNSQMQQDGTTKATGQSLAVQGGTLNFVNTPESAAESTQPVFNNYITNKAYWDMIILVYAAQGVTASPRVTLGETVPDLRAGPQYGPPAGTTYTIASNADFTSTIESLRTLIPPIKAEQGHPGKHWNILSGGKISKDKNGNLKPTQDVVWGWVPDPPTASTDIALTENYRLARTFVYRPSDKKQIAAGQTKVLSLQYDWTSRGYFGVGLPPIYGITFSQTDGQYHIYTSSESFRNATDAQETTILGTPAQKYGSPVDQNTGMVPTYTLADINKIQGVEVNFNFDTRPSSDQVVQGTATGIIINVWNFFLREIVDVNINILGDPWLDNTLFLNGDALSSNATSNHYGTLLGDYLVDIYHAYFDLFVYKPGEGGINGLVFNPILSGHYLCLKGLKHTISEGEYTTSISMMKSF